MKKLSIIVFLTILSLNANSQITKFSINNPGIMVYNNLPYDSVTKMRIQDPRNIPSFDIDFRIKKANFCFNFIYYDIQILKGFDINKDGLSIRRGFYLSLNNHQKIIATNRYNLNCSVGISTKVTNDVIFYTYPFAWDPLFDDSGLSKGGIAINAGLSQEINLTKRFFINSSFKTVNFVYSSNYQNHALFIETGIGYRFKKEI